MKLSPISKGVRRRRNSRVRITEKVAADVFCGVQNRADHHAISLGCVEYEVRLKPKTPIAGAQFVHRLADARKVREKVESPFKPA
jgi:hypothetical protein